MEQSLDSRALEALIASYCAAWNEHDPAQRERLLHGVWEQDATYTDPTAHVVGSVALGEHIGRVQNLYPGARIVATSAPDAHHLVVRFAWKMVRSDGASLPECVDFLELSGDGKIRRVVGFFGPLSPRESP